MIQPQTEPVLEPETVSQPSPATLGTVTLELLRLWTGARSAALFVWAADGPRLLLSDKVDQGVLDDVRRLWEAPPLQFRVGVPFRGQFQREFLAVPCVSRGELRALAYLEVSAAGVQALPVQQIVALTEIVALTLGERPAAVSRPRPVVSLPANAPAAWVAGPAADGVNLRLLLERHEWNVARVARLLGVTRMTIYNRMRRQGVARLKVRKSEWRRRRQAS
jgi:hypothetical protein